MSRAVLSCVDVDILQIHFSDNVSFNRDLNVSQHLTFNIEPIGNRRTVITVNYGW